MIEERAIVSRMASGAVWVRAFGPESCPRCAEGRGCGGGVLAKLVGRHRPEIQVQGTLQNLSVGDTVIVGVDEGVVMQASLWVYAIPLAGMFALGAFAHLVLAAHDLLVAAFGLSGLVAGFGLTRWAGERAEHSARFRPSLLRRESASDSCARIGDL